MKQKTALAILVLTTAISIAARAATTTFSDSATFFAATAATDATGPYPDDGGLLHRTLFTAGSVTFSTFRPSDSFTFGDVSSRLPGTEFMQNGADEGFDIALATSALALGFDFVEPRLDPNVNTTPVDSTFQVTLLMGASPVGSFTFNAPDDTAAFYGISSDLAFDHVQIREVVGADDNEFFGRFYVTQVPEPSTWTLLLFWGTALGFVVRKRRDHRAA
jgi:hypothetical protein